MEKIERRVLATGLIPSTGKGLDFDSLRQAKKEYGNFGDIKVGYNHQRGELSYSIYEKVLSETIKTDDEKFRIIMDILDEIEGDLEGQGFTDGIDEIDSFIKSYDEERANEKRAANLLSQRGASIKSINNRISKKKRK